MKEKSRIIMLVVAAAMLYTFLSSGCGEDVKGQNIRDVMNEDDSFTYDGVATGYSHSESYKWRITTSMALLKFQSVNITSGSVRLTISNPSTVPPLFDYTFTGDDQVSSEHLGPALADEWSIDLQFDEASGEFIFSLAAEKVVD